MARQTLTEGSKHAIATARAKAKGFTDFSEGSAGAKERKKIAEGIAEGTKIVPGPARKMARMKRAASRHIGSKHLRRK